MRFRGHVRSGWGGVLAVAAMLLPGIAGADWADMPPEVRQDVVGAVAVVGRVWPDDAALLEFHSTLAKRYKDTPGLDAFRAQETWVSVITSRSVRFPGVFIARTESGNAPVRGDIVQVRLADFRKVDSYFQLNTVLAVLCRAGAPDYDACAQRNPLSWVLRSGAVVSR